MTICEAKLKTACLFLAIILSFLPVSGFASSGEYDASRPDLLQPDHLSCEAAILIELDSGEVIFEKNADAMMYPASTTKILTSYLGLTMAETDQTCIVSSNALIIPEDSSKIGLAVGEQINLLDLIYATMLASGNDGANVIAEAVSGSVPAFVDLMNRAADAFGCTATHFANAHGYHDDNHYTTARDMATISRIALKNETLRQIGNTQTYELPRDNVFGSRTVTNTNRLISESEKYESYRYEYATGLKTGQHSAAGYCLVGTATKNGISLLSVVFHSASDSQRYSDTKKLFEYGFTQYISTSIREIYAMNPKVIDISGFSLEDRNLGKLELSLEKVDALTTDTIVTTQNNLDYWIRNFNDLTITEYTRAFRAPISQGEVMGTLTYYPQNATPVVYNLIAARSVKAREQLAPTIDEIIREAENDPNPFPRFTIKFFIKYILLPLFVIFIMIRIFMYLFRKNGKRRKHSRTIKPKEPYFR